MGITKTALIGAGGYVTSIDIQGTEKVCRHDVAGASIWEPSRGEWRQLCTYSGIRETDIRAQVGMGGVYEIRIAPSRTNWLYASFINGFWRSMDRGWTWTKIFTTE